MTEVELIAQMLSSGLETGANGATIFLAVFLWRLERRLHNLEIYTGIKKLITKTD